MSDEADMERLIGLMYDDLGRWPTEEEVTGFIFGDEKKRRQILLEGKDV